MGKLIGYIPHNGHYIKVNNEKVYQKSREIFPQVIQDSMNALRHPVTGAMIESKSEWRRINQERGLTEVGSQLQSEMRDARLEKITDSVILDKIEKAETIFNDPSKFAARQQENLERRERAEKLLKWG